MAPPIPVQNLYYLLCYAWDRLDEGAIVDVSRLPSTELVDLFAVVLSNGVRHVARRGLDRGYTAVEDELRGIRGRIDILATERRFLSKHGRAACVFDELTPNTLPNQIIKATLKVLARVPEIDKGNRAALLSLARDLTAVDDIRVTAQSFNKVQLNSNNAFYRFLLNICALVHDSWLPDQTTGLFRFRDFVRNERKMAYVFQDFVYNFLRIERRDLRVYREKIDWKAEAGPDSELSLLPEMNTDISITAAGGRKVIIDTKYYRDTLSEYYGTGTIHSDNLYQLFSYMMNSPDSSRTIEGILLYPKVDKPVHATYTIMGMTVRIETIDLAKPWQDIRDELKALVGA